MRPRPAAARSTVVPVPRMLGAFFAGGLVAAAAVPALGRVFAGGDEGLSLVVLLLTWVAMTAVSGAYLFPMSVVLGFRRDWFRFGLGCLAGLELILFVLVPLSLEGEDSLGLAGQSVLAGASLILSLLVFGQIAKAARRYLPPAQWTVAAKVSMALVAAAAGLISRLVISMVLGTDPVSSVLSEDGILLAVSGGLAGLSLAEALDRATRPPLVAVEGRGLVAKTIRIGVALLLALHLIWLLYLSRVL